MHLTSQSTPHTTLTSASNSLSTSAMLSQINALSSSLDTKLHISNIYNKPKQIASKALLGDMSPYKELEFLSLQMTEQAIN